MGNTLRSSNPLTEHHAAGPLVVSATNPRYFTAASSDDAGRKVAYLTGSHICICLPWRPARY
jgi:hypothetical protein